MRAAIVKMISISTMMVMIRILMFGARVMMIITFAHIYSLTSISKKTLFQIG